MNQYKKILQDNLPKLFALYNLDPCSSTYGYGDRLYWGWKVSDFANATMQGGVHALSIAIRLGLIENIGFALEVIDSAIMAVARMRYRNGSLAEAYPNEHSFCVTALVAFDVLSAIRHLGTNITEERKKKYLDVIRPLIHFITYNNEKHAIISNHLATGVAAIELWNMLTGEDAGRGEEFLSIIYRHQSREGWYREYDGADPGYQTLCTYYLFCIHEITKDKELLESLIRSGSFLKYFVHPDNTMGGLYGSRNTEVYYPAGIIALSPVSDDFALIASLLHRGISDGNHILPQDIDINNFVPLINSYAVAALHYETGGVKIRETNQAPYEKIFSKIFDHAGIYIHSSDRYYAIVNYKKGGTLKVFDKEKGVLDTEHGGIFGRLASGMRFSTQQFDERQNFNDNTINAGFFITNDSYLNPATSVLLRILSLTFFRSVYLGNLFKKFIVRILMTGRKGINGKAVRKFEFTDDKIIIHENITEPKRCDEIVHYGKCRAIHMASSGYYVKQDQEKPLQSRLVTFLSVTNMKK
jgi:hypothetical protein